MVSARLGKLFIAASCLGLGLGTLFVPSCSAGGGGGGPAGGGAGAFGGAAGDASVDQAQSGGSGGSGGSSGDGGINLDAISSDGCAAKCSSDFHKVLSCNGVELQKCSEDAANALTGG